MSQVLELSIDDSFSKNWDEKICMEIQVYDPDLAQLRSYIDKPYTIDLALTPPEISEPLDVTVTDPPQDDKIRTGILEDLNQVCNDAKADRNSVKYPPITDDPTVKNNFDENRDNYYEIRLYHHAEEICTHIDGLIQLDKYPSEIFGKYQTIREYIFKENDHSIADRLLGQLIILGRSVVPPEMKYETMETVEPTISSEIRTVEQK